EMLDGAPGPISVDVTAPDIASTRKQQFVVVGIFVGCLQQSVPWLEGLKERIEPIAHDVRGRRQCEQRKNTGRHHYDLPVAAPERRQELLVELDYRDGGERQDGRPVIGKNDTR